MRQLHDERLTEREGRGRGLFRVVKEGMGGEMLCKEKGAAYGCGRVDLEMKEIMEVFRS